MFLSKMQNISPSDCALKYSLKWIIMPRIYCVYFMPFHIKQNPVQNIQEKLTGILHFSWISSLFLFYFILHFKKPFLFRWQTQTNIYLLKMFFLHKAGKKKR